MWLALAADGNFKEETNSWKMTKYEVSKDDSVDDGWLKSEARDGLKLRCPYLDKYVDFMGMSQKADLSAKTCSICLCEWVNMLRTFVCDELAKRDKFSRIG